MECQLLFLMGHALLTVSPYTHERNHLDHRLYMQCTG